METEERACERKGEWESLGLPEASSRHVQRKVSTVWNQMVSFPY